MTLYDGWEKIAEKYLEQKGWLDGKNCSIKYQAKVDIPNNEVIYHTIVKPYNQIEEITYTMRIE